MCKEVRNIKNIFIAIVACGALLVACGGPEGKLIGKYEGRAEIFFGTPEDPIVPEGLLKEALDGMKSKLEKARLLLELKQDGVCTMRSATGEPPDTIYGTWSLDDQDSAVMIKWEDTDADLMPGTREDMVLDVFDGGKVLSMTASDDTLSLGAMTFSLTFTRQ